MKKTCIKLLSVILTLIMAIAPVTVFTAFAEDEYPAGYWTLIPTSPAGLQPGDVWFDFTALFDSSATEEELAAALARFNCATWYANFDDAMVKCVSDDPELNGVYTRSQQPFICCAKEVGVSWRNVFKNLAGASVGDYYMDKDVFIADATNGYAAYFAAQYQRQHPEVTITDEMMQQLRIRSAELAEEQYTANVYRFNPNGTLYRVELNGMPFPYTRYIVDYSIGQEMMLVIHALEVSLRQITAEDIAASSWIRVAASREAADWGEYYLDFTDVAAVMAAFNMSTAPSQQELDILLNGEWYADLTDLVVTGKISIEDDGVLYEQWLPESAQVFGLLKIKTCNHAGAGEFAAVPATATEHGYTAGVYCAECGAWLSGHEIIHNELGEQINYIAPTVSAEGSYDVLCTVCGETTHHTVPKLTPPETQPENPSGGSGTNFFMNLIQRIAAFFRNLFRIFG